MGVGQYMRGGQLAAAAGLVLTIESTHLLTKGGLLAWCKIIQNEEGIMHGNVL